MNYNSPSFRYLLLCGEDMVGDSIITACSLKLRLLGPGNIHFLLTYASSSCLENKSTEHVSGLLEDSLARWSFSSIPWPHPKLEFKVRRKMLFTRLWGCLTWTYSSFPLNIKNNQAKLIFWYFWKKMKFQFWEVENFALRNFPKHKRI